MNKKNAEHYQALQIKVLKIEENQNQYNLDYNFTVNSFEDKIKEMSTNHETATRVAKDSYTDTLKKLDTEKTRREREHLDATKKAQDQHTFD